MRFFSTGTAKDAADFLLTKTKLSRYAGTQSCRGAATVSKVLNTITPPVFNKPDCPERAKFDKHLESQEKDMMVMECQLKAAEFTKKVKGYLAYNHKWEDNGPKLFNLVLQHYPLVLILKIEG